MQNHAEKKSNFEHPTLMGKDFVARTYYFWHLFLQAFLQSLSKAFLHDLFFLEHCLFFLHFFWHALLQESLHALFILQHCLLCSHFFWQVLLQTLLQESLRALFILQHCLLCSHVSGQALLQGFTSSANAIVTLNITRHKSESIFFIIKLYLLFKN